MQEYPQEYARISCKNIHIHTHCKDSISNLNNHHVYSNNNWAVELAEISPMIVDMYNIQDADTIDQQIAPLTASDGSPSSKVHAKGHLHVPNTVKKLGECLHLLKRYTTLHGMRICSILVDQSYPSLIHKPHIGGIGMRLRDIPITCPNSNFNVT